LHVHALLQGHLVLGLVLFSENRKENYVILWLHDKQSVKTKILALMKDNGGKHVMHFKLLL
jgi:hypothetical protein